MRLCSRRTRDENAWRSAISSRNLCVVVSGSPGLYREKRERAMKSANARRTRDERLGGGVGRSRSANPARDAFPEPPRSAIVSSELGSKLAASRHKPVEDSSSQLGRWMDLNSTPNSEGPRLYGRFFSILYVFP